MSTYLDKLQTTLNQVQARQITNLLIQKKESGEINNLEEFRARLTELTNNLLAEHITPSLKLFAGIANKIIDSETFDFMIARIRDDLEASFSESNSLSEVLAAHKNIINNVLLKAIRLGIAELETKVSTYEFLAKNNFGFDGAQFNTFKASQNLRTLRTSLDSNILFRDPRTKDIIDNDVTLDLISESILLDNKAILNVVPKSIRQVFDSESTQSVDQVAFESSDINNVIDGSPGTFWVYSILQKQPVTSVTIKLEIDLGNYYDINFINIEAAVIFPMTFVKLLYVDSNSELQTLTFNEIVFNTPKNIYFNKVTTNRIFVVFSQTNTLEIQYTSKPEVVNYDSAVLGNTDNPTNLDSIAEQIKALITSSKIVQDIFFIPPGTSTPVQKSFFDYSIGLDNIRIGYSLFEQKSIFVSSQVKIDNLGQLAVKSKEVRPVESAGVISMTTDTYPQSSDYFHGSIEYWAAIFNFETNNQLIDIDIVPILPVGVTRVSHENLVLGNQFTSSVGNAGVLMFYTKHFTSDDLDDIQVYRNGTLLIHSIDWVIDEFLTNDFPSPSTTPNQVGIRILNPGNTDFYTVSYTPLVSNSRANPIEIVDMSLQNSLIKVPDLVGDGSIRMGTNNILYISPKKNSGKITSYSKVNLIIILRRSSPNENLSPAVQEYLLLTSSNDSEKFNVK